MPGLRIWRHAQSWDTDSASAAAGYVRDGRRRADARAGKRTNGSARGARFFERIRVRRGEREVELAWRDGQWWVTVGRWTRPLLPEPEHGAGWYDPGDGLPSRGGHYRGNPEIADAPAHDTAFDADRYRLASRAAAIRAAERLLDALGESGGEPSEAELFVHPGWRPTARR